MEYEKVFKEDSPNINIDDISSENIVIVVIEDVEKYQKNTEEAMMRLEAKLKGNIVLLMADCKENFEKIIEQIKTKIKNVDLFFIDGKFPSNYEREYQRKKTYFEIFFKRNPEIKYSFKENYLDGEFTGKKVIKAILNDLNIDKQRVFSTSSARENAVKQVIHRSIPNGDGMVRIESDTAFLLPMDQLIPKPARDDYDLFIDSTENRLRKNGSIA